MFNIDYNVLNQVKQAMAENPNMNCRLKFQFETAPLSIQGSDLKGQARLMNLETEMIEGGGWFFKNYYLRVEGKVKDIFRYMMFLSSLT